MYEIYGDYIAPFGLRVWNKRENLCCEIYGNYTAPMGDFESEEIKESTIYMEMISHLPGP